MLSTKQRIKTTMTTLGMDLWTLAQKADLNVRELSSTMMGGDGELSVRDKGRLVDFMVKRNLCPECGSGLMNVGGCVECFCGWSKC